MTLQLRCVALFSCLVAIAFSSLADAAPRPGSAKPSSYVMVTVGIVGGFVPPHVRTQAVVLQQGDKYSVWLKQQPKRNEKPSYKTASVGDMEVAALIAKLKKMEVAKLPREQPTGCQDIYGLDTSLAVRHGDTFWRNGGPGGCVHGRSKVQATAAHKEMFRKATKLVTAFAEKHAGKPTDAAAFRKVFITVQSDAPRKGKQLR